MPAAGTGSEVLAKREPAPRFFFVAIALASAVTTWVGAALSWDGSYYFFHLLNRGEPVVIFQRYSAAVLQLPVLAALRLTDNIDVLRVAFGAPLAAIPLLTLGGCWLLVRRRAPGLFVWPALGVGVALLPALFFQVSETIDAYQLAWILFVVTVVGVDRRSLLVAAPATALIFFLSAVSAYLFVVVAMMAVVMALRDGPRRRRLLLWAAALLVLAVTRRLVLQVDYQQHPIEIGAVALQFLSLRGKALVGVLMAWAAGMLLLLPAPKAPGRRATIQHLLPLAPLALALVAMVWWAWDPKTWSGAIDYRDRAISFEAPLVGLMVLDWWRRAGSEGPLRPDRGRRLVVNAAGIVFLAVLVTQSVSWTTVTSRLRARLDSATGACVPDAAVRMEQTAADHWSKPTLAIALQGRSPTRLILDPADCDQLRARRVLRLNYFDTQPATGGWFHFPALL